MDHRAHLVAQGFHRRGIAEPALHQHHHLVLAVLALHRECGDIAAAQRPDAFCRPLDVLRPDVAAVVQDEILDPPGDDHLATDHVAHVAGIEEAVAAQHRVGGLGALEIAGHQARALDKDAADVALAQHLARIVAHHDRMAGQRPAAHHEAAHPFGRRVGGVGRNGAPRQLVVGAIDDVGPERLIDIGEGAGKRRFGHAIARQECPLVEPGRCQLAGKGIQHLGAHHVAADAGNAPGAEVKARRAAVDAPAGEIVTEGGRIAYGRTVVRHELEPQDGPACKRSRRQVVDAHLAHHGREAETDQPHVVIKRQPRKGAVIGPHLEAVPQDAAHIGRHRLLGDEHALGAGGRAGGILDIGDLVGGERLEPGLALGQGLKRLVGENRNDASPAGGLAHQTLKVLRGHHDRGGSRRQHAANALHEGIAAADMDAVGHRAGHEAGILAAEEHRHEFGARFSHDRHPGAALEAEPLQSQRHRDGALAQHAIGQDMRQFAARRIEVEPGRTAGGVIEALGQCIEGAQHLLPARRCPRRWSQRVLSLTAPRPSSGDHFHFQS